MHCGTVSYSNWDGATPGPWVWGDSFLGSRVFNSEPHAVHKVESQADFIPDDFLWVLSGLVVPHLYTCLVLGVGPGLSRALYWRWSLWYPSQWGGRAGFGKGGKGLNSQDQQSVIMIFGAEVAVSFFEH